MNPKVNDALEMLFTVYMFVAVGAIPVEQWYFWIPTALVGYYFIDKQWKWRHSSREKEKNEQTQEMAD